MENIDKFLFYARVSGVRTSDLFTTVDLYEGKDIPQVVKNQSANVKVIVTLLSLERIHRNRSLNIKINHLKPLKLSDTSSVTIGEYVCLLTAVLTSRDWVLY